MTLSHEEFAARLNPLTAQADKTPPQMKAPIFRQIAALFAERFPDMPALAQNWIDCAEELEQQYPFHAPTYDVPATVANPPKLCWVQTPLGDWNAPGWQCVQQYNDPVLFALYRRGKIFHLMVGTLDACKARAEAETK
jgi:hypothetical protein